MIVPSERVYLKTVAEEHADDRAGHDAETADDGEDEVDDARDEVAGRRLEAQPLLRVQRRELAELDAVARLLGVGTVDALDLDERVELLRLLALARLAYDTGDGVALAQAVALAHLQRDVDVVVAGQVAARAHEGVAVEDVEAPRQGVAEVQLAAQQGLVVGQQHAGARIDLPRRTQRAQRILRTVFLCALRVFVVKSPSKINPCWLYKNSNVYNHTTTGYNINANADQHYV